MNSIIEQMLNQHESLREFFCLPLSSCHNPHVLIDADAKINLRLVVMVDFDAQVL